jgi:acetate kinase
VRVLVLNAGSSSLKASVIDDGETLHRTNVSWGDDASRTTGRDAALSDVVHALTGADIAVASIEAVGHRVVHGGRMFLAPVLLGASSLESLAALGDLAPLHNDVALETIRAAQRALSSIPHVACFDTAFHATLPKAVARYPVPESWSTEWGIRRFGFHGLSVEWSVRRAGELLGRRPSELNVVVAHLGSGCSVTAVRGGHSVATSMGFTPLEGLMMGTRAGSVDPGILLYLLRTERTSLDELEDALQHRSGLLGVSGRTADVRQLEAAAEAGDARARLAIEMFVQRAAAGIAAAAVSLPRLDALVFTGGIGENAGRVRATIVDRLAVLGIQPIASIETGADRVLPENPGSRAIDGSGPPVIRVEAREDLVIAAAATGIVSA